MKINSLCKKGKGRALAKGQGLTPNTKKRQRKEGREGWKDGRNDGGRKEGREK